MSQQGPAKIIGIVQSKGGVGRSTVATNLSAALSANSPTLLIDADMPQGTSASWGAVRKAGPGLGRLRILSAGDRGAITEWVARAADRFEYIVIDGPPRITDTTLAILELGDLVVLPLGTSAPEIWACADLVNLLRRLRAQGLAVDARILWTRYRWYTRAARELTGRAEGQLGLPSFQIRLSHRVAYNEALARGLSVEEWSDKAAKAEMSALLDDIRGVLARSSGRPRADATIESCGMSADPPLGARSSVREGI